MESSELYSLIPGLGVILLAVLSGAGGAALLELIWKPRRARKTAATILYAELMQNLQVVRFQSEIRFQGGIRLSIPADFRMVRLGWDTVVESFRELPVDLVRKLLLLYSRFEDLNRAVTEYGRVYDRLNDLDEKDARRVPLDNHLLSVVDVFNTGLDHVDSLSLEILPELVKAGRIREKEGDPRDFKEEAAKLMAERRTRIEVLKRSR